MSRPATCRICARKPVVRKTVSYCYDCHPSGPVDPPPCRRCGSLVNYYSAGLCERCHQYAPQPVTSCLDCYAWGATRTTRWLCRACIGWRHKNPTIAECLTCRGQRHVGRGGYCRLCWRTASTWHTANSRYGSTYLPLDVTAGNRHGQQLFLAALLGPVTRGRQRRTPAGQANQAERPVTLVRRRSERAPFRQLLLFDNNPPSWLARHSIPAPRDPRLAASLQTLAEEIGGQRGWSRTSRRRVTLGLNTLLGWQTAPGKPISASDIARLGELGLQCASLVKIVLTEAGLFLDDRTPAVDDWFARTTAGLPTPMTDEVTVWFAVLRHGSTTPPRYRPRDETTVRMNIRHALPPLRAWAASGHTTLREISVADVAAVLPASGNPRALMGAALRSMFRVLKGRRVIFINPIARIATGAPERRQPMPANLNALRDALHSEDTAAAAMVALFAFHGLRPGQLRRLHLTDVRDGRLHLQERVVPLAQPVRDRIDSWLDQRAVRWPRTVNPHLFIHQRTAPHIHPVGTRWLKLRMGMTASSIRDDRILDEAHATQGDVRRLVDLFDITVQTAARYTSTVEHPGLRE